MNRLRILAVIFRSNMTLHHRNHDYGRLSRIGVVMIVLAVLVVIGLNYSRM